MIDLKPLVRAILERYTLPWHGIHGIGHWARVLENGLLLARETGSDIEVVQLFAVFHDSQRTNEGCDAGHGWRGAELAASFRNKSFTLSDTQFGLLYDACAGHTDGGINGDVTVQTCWDADRLDIGRVGVCPDPRRLCTAVAKRSDLLKRADGRACFQVVPEIVVSDWKIDVKDSGIQQTGEA